MQSQTELSSRVILFSNILENGLFGGSAGCKNLHQLRSPFSTSGFTHEEHLKFAKEYPTSILWNRTTSYGRLFAWTLGFGHRSSTHEVNCPTNIVQIIFVSFQWQIYLSPKSLTTFRLPYPLVMAFITRPFASFTYIHSKIRPLRLDHSIGSGLSCAYLHTSSTYHIWCFYRASTTHTIWLSTWLLGSRTTLSGCCILFQRRCQCFEDFPRNQNHTDQFMRAKPQSLSRLRRPLPV